MYALNLDVLPEYYFSSFRFFKNNERHITRYCNENVLLVVFDSVLRFCEDGREVEVQKGEYYIQKRGLYQKGTKSSPAPKYYYIHFGAEFADELSLGSNSLKIHGSANIKNLIPLFKRLDVLNVSGASAVEKSSVFYEILSVLKLGNTGTRNNSVVLKVISLVTNDVSKKYSLSFLAEQCGYSCNQLINIFKAETGQTPISFINNYKLENAKQLLISSNKSLKQIAYECGFSDYISFYKSFTGKYGCSPLKWKEFETK